MGKIITLTISLLVGSTAVGPSDGSCCTNKIVGGVKYSLVGIEDTEDYNCRSNCVYEDDSNPGSRFCFATGLPGDKEVECSVEDFVQYCHEYVQPFLELLSASNQTIGCCNDGELTPAFCGGDPFNLCQDACGDITCVKLVPDPHDSQYCSQSGKNILGPIMDPALGYCLHKLCRGNDNCPCCMSDTYRTTCVRKCKCRCKCKKYSLPGLCKITSCSGCPKYDKKCPIVTNNPIEETTTPNTTIPCGDGNYTGTWHCLDGTFPGKWTDGQTINGSFNDSQACENATTNLYSFLYSFSWNHKTNACIAVNSTAVGFSTSDADLTDWCASCPNSAASGIWDDINTNAVSAILHRRSYADCRYECTTGLATQCQRFSWNMKADEKGEASCYLFVANANANLTFTECSYWCSSI